jgi:hypothetical protein
MRRPATTIGLLALVACTAACSKDDGKSEANVEENTTAKVQAFFDSLIDGVQLIESAEDMSKQTGAIDESTAPPSYRVTYEGCVDGYVGGNFCVQEGLHVIDVVTDTVHIIRSVDQTYALNEFGSVPDYRMTGTIASHVDVTVDTNAQTTGVAGTAKGTLVASGQLAGDVGVDLVIGGGRNYTESAATPIEVTGTLTYQGEAYPVEGGFLRE